MGRNHSRLIEDVDAPLGDVEDAPFPHVFERLAILYLPQNLDNDAGNGFPAAKFIGQFHHRVGMSASAEFLVAFFPQCVDGSDLGPRQIDVSINLGVARTGDPHFDGLRINKWASELVIDESGCRARYRPGPKAQGSDR